MKRRLAGWGRLWTLFAAIVMALSLAAAPAIEAVKHGPGAMVAEADHRAYHSEHGHSHDMPSGHHDSGDHDHVSAAVLASPGPRSMPHRRAPFDRKAWSQMARSGRARDGRRA